MVYWHVLKPPLYGCIKVKSEVVSRNHIFWASTHRELTNASDPTYPCSRFFIQTQTQQIHDLDQACFKGALSTQLLKLSTHCHINLCILLFFCIKRLIICIGIHVTNCANCANFHLGTITVFCCVVAGLFQSKCKELCKLSVHFYSLSSCIESAASLQTL